MTSADGDAGRGVRAYVHLAYGYDAESYPRRHAEGQAPDRTPYGFHEAERFGARVTFARDTLSHRAERIAAFLRRRFHFDIVHAYANRHAIRDADIVWTMSEFDATSVRALMALGLVPKRPIIGAAIWIVNWWDTRLLPWQRRLFLRLLRGLDLLTFHSAPCLDEARRKLPGVRCELMPFGIATDTFLSAPAEPADGRIRIVAAGNDKTRDWDVLLRAFGNDPDVDLVIINQELGDDLLTQYRNLTIPRRPSMAEFRRLYRSATYIAIPLHENNYSGLTVALEAMAIGVPVLATRSGGVTTYLAEDEALFVPVGDAQVWRDAIHRQGVDERRAMAERAHARFLREDYSTTGMMQRFVRASRALLDRKAG